MGKYFSDFRRSPNTESIRPSAPSTITSTTFWMPPGTILSLRCNISAKTARTIKRDKRKKHGVRDREITDMENFFCAERNLHNAESVTETWLKNPVG